MVRAPTPPSDQHRQQIVALRRTLLRWFAVYGRDLPWRRTRDPYHILISEVMLQQTQVDRVKEYYARFLKKYPTVQSLAKATPARVRDVWQGLGYYARARNLHATSKVVTHEHAGNFPQHVDDLRALPGIGRYTAGAVASFAFGQRAPIVDTNVARVLQRLCGITAPLKQAATQQQLWTLAEHLIARGDVWTINQAVMDFGATICTARKPSCGKCPLRKRCAYVQAQSTAGCAPTPPDRTSHPASLLRRARAKSTRPTTD